MLTTLTVTLLLFCPIQTQFNNIVQTTSTTSLSNMNFKDSIVSENGQLAYLLFLQNGLMTINVYNLTTAAITLIGTFNQNGVLIYPEKLCLTDLYLLAFSPSSPTVYYFALANRTLVGSFSLGQNIQTMMYLPRKRLVICATTSTGKILYFSSSINIPLTVTQLANGLTSPIYFSISPNQTYLGVGQSANKIQIYKLETNTSIFTTITSSKSCRTMTWHPNQTLFFFANDQQDYFYTVNMASFSVIQSPSIYRPSNQWAPYHMIYMTGTDQLIIVGYYNDRLNNVTMMVYDWRTGVRGFVKEIYFHQMLAGLNFDVANNSFFTTYSTNKAQFFTLNGTFRSPTFAASNITNDGTFNTTKNTVSSATIDSIKTSENTTTDLSKINGTTDLSKINGTTDLSKINATTDLSKINATTDLSTTDATTDLSTTDATTDLSTTDATNDLSKTDATNDLSTTDATNDLSITNENKTTESNTTDSNNTLENTSQTNQTLNPTTNSSSVPQNITSNHSAIEPTPKQQKFPLNPQTITNTTFQNEFLGQAAFQTYQNIMSTLLQNQPLVALNSVPGSRKLLKPIFAFFINFDDLWLYIYHPRHYNRVIKTIFDTIQSLQSQKSELISFSQLWELFGIDTQSIRHALNYKLNYTSAKFIDIQNQSNGFYINTLNLFFSNLFFTLAIYCFFRMLFHLTSEYKISIFLRPFAFWPFYLIMFLEGNVQFLTYLYVYDTQNMFALNPIHKLNQACVTLTFFFLLLFCTASFFIFKHHYQHLTKYLIENVRLRMPSITYFTLFAGYKHLALGFFHALFDNNYRLKLASILTTETIICVFCIYLLTKKTCFQYKTRVWICQITSFIRILLATSFLFDHSEIPIQNSVFEAPHLVLSYSYIACFLISIATQLAVTASELNQMYCTRDAMTKFYSIPIISKNPKQNSSIRRLKLKKNLRPQIKQSMRKVNFAQTEIISHLQPVPAKASIFRSELQQKNHLKKAKILKNRLKINSIIKAEARAHLLVITKKTNPQNSSKSNNQI